MIVLPREVTGRVEALGEAGRRWLAHLEETVCHLEQEWGVSVGEVLSCLDCREEALSGASCMLVHGDAHANNTLVCPGGGFKFVDPDGLYYERAHDLGVLMREWMGEYRTDPTGLALWRCRFLHQQTAVPAGGIWDWGYLQTVSTGLVLMQIGQKQYGKAMLELAGEWAGHWDRVRE